VLVEEDATGARRLPGKPKLESRPLDILLSRIIVWTRDHGLVQPRNKSRDGTSRLLVMEETRFLKAWQCRDNDEFIRHMKAGT
jgi:hypothetical protein